MDNERVELSLVCDLAVVFEHAPTDLLLSIKPLWSEGGFAISITPPETTLGR